MQPHSCLSKHVHMKSANLDSAIVITLMNCTHRKVLHIALCRECMLHGDKHPERLRLSSSFAIFNEQISYQLNGTAPFDQQPLPVPS